MERSRRSSGVSDRAGRLTRSKPKNEWRALSPSYFMCLRYDVWLGYGGEWFASSYCGPRFDESFPSAEAAMRFCDNAPDY
jgi:hypothetical protein